MKHEERMQLAGSISARVVARLPGDVVISGVYGSTARNTDTQWSDLEMLFVVRSGSTFRGRQFLYRGMPIGLIVIERNKLEHQLANPDFGWWDYLMHTLASMMVLYGDLEQVLTWLRLGQSVPSAKYREVLEANLSWLVHEPFGRIKSCLVRRNERDVGSAVMETLRHMQGALCLLNERWAANNTTYQGFVDTFSFTKLPEGWHDLIPTLW